MSAHLSAHNETIAAPVADSADNAAAFDWSGPDVVIADQPSIACHFNAFGQIVLRACRWPEDDAVLWIDVHHVPALITKLQAMLKEAST